MWISLTPEQIGVIRAALIGSNFNKEINQIIAKFDERIADETDPKTLYYRQRADDLQRDGEIEFDSDMVVSAGEDPGAYVMGWYWIYDDREPEEESEDGDEG